MKKTTALDSILTLWSLALLFVVAAILSGCASPAEVATAVIKFQIGTNQVSVSNPKDVSFESLTVNPSTGEISVRKYRSSANEAAIAASQAQAEAQAQFGMHALDLLKEVSEKAGAASGVPVPMRGPSQRPTVPIP